MLFTTVQYTAPQKGQPSVNDHGYRNIPAALLDETTSIRLYPTGYGMNRHPGGKVNGLYVEGVLLGRPIADGRRKEIKVTVRIAATEAIAVRICEWLDDKFRDGYQVRISPTGDPMHNMRLNDFNAYRLFFVAAIGREADEDGNYPSGVRFFAQETAAMAEKREGIAMAVKKPRATRSKTRKAAEQPELLAF